MYWNKLRKQLQRSIRNNEYIYIYIWRWKNAKKKNEQRNKLGKREKQKKYKIGKTKTYIVNADKVKTILILVNLFEKHSNLSHSFNLVQTTTLKTEESKAKNRN